MMVCSVRRRPAAIAASGTGEVVPVSASDAFDDVQSAQAGELSGEGSGRALAEQRQEISGGGRRC